MSGVGRSIRTIATTAVACLALLANVGAVSAEEPRLAFLETGVVTVSMPLQPDTSPSASATPASDPVVVHVVNLADADATVTVQIANIKDAAGSATTKVPGLPNIVVENAPVAAGDILEVSLVGSAAATTSPSYSGELVATSSRGGLVRLPLTVKFPDVPEPTTTEDPQTDLHKPVADPVEVSATKYIPTFLSEAAGINEPFGHPALSLAPDLASGTIGTLRSASGNVAEAAIVKPAPEAEGLPELRITRYASADVYTGKFEAGSGETATKTTIKLSVRDHILWAAAALLIGLYAAGSLETFLGQDRPRRRFRLFLAKEQDRAIGLAKNQRSHFHDIPLVIRPQKAIEIFSRGLPGRATGLLATAATLALDDFDAAWSRADRDTKWSPGGERANGYRGYVDTLEKLGVRVGRIGQIVASLGRYVGSKDLAEMPAVVSARAAVAGDLIKEPELLDAKGQALTDSMPLLLLLVAAYERDADYRRELEDLNKPATTLDPITALLSGVDVRDDVAVKKIVTSLDAAYSAILRPPPKTTPAGDGLAAGGEAAQRTDLRVDHVDGFPASEAFEEADAIAAILRDRERRFAILAGALVLGTGLSLLYFNDPSWGSIGDYLAALVWGTTVGAGLQLAKRIGDGLTASA